MSAFWDKVKKNKKEDGENSQIPVVKDAKKSVKTEDKEKDKKAKKKAKKRVLSQQEAKIASKVLVSPKISEAAMNQQVLGKYVFNVAMDATKQEVSQAVEAFYGVDVVKVNVTSYSSRNRNFRGIAGSKKAFKKAVVTIKSGQSIDVFKETK